MIIMCKVAFKLIAASVLLAPWGAVQAQFTEDDLVLHGSNSDCWTVVAGNVYDVTSYAAGHPGGSDKVFQMCGVDASNLFNTEHASNPTYMDAFTTLKGTFSGTAPTAPAPSSPDPAVGGACFSADSTVQVDGKGQVPMKALKVGDKIFTGGANGYEKVYAFGHHEPSKKVDFLQIHTESHNTPLSMTGAHMVYVSGKNHPVRADSVHVGDTLQDNGYGSRVTKIGSTQKKGLYAPLTRSGTLMVDGVKASSYISLQDGATEYVELQHGSKPMSQHDGIHLVLAPFRMFCMLSSGDACHTYDDEGKPAFISNGIHFLEWLDALDLNIVTQVMLLGAALPIFGFLYALEYLARIAAFAALVATSMVLVGKTARLEVNSKAKKMI